MRTCTVYYRPSNHEGSINMNDASYCYVMDAESMGTFANYKNGERVAGLTGKDINGDWKRFRFENVIRLSGI